MPANKSKTPNLFDPEALLEAQRRNFTAFTSAGNIVVSAPAKERGALFFEYSRPDVRNAVVRLGTIDHHTSL